MSPIVVRRRAGWLVCCLAACCWLGGNSRLSAQAEPPHPILTISGSGSGASTILSSWTEDQYTNSFVPRLGPRNDDYGFCPAVVPGDTGWSWSFSSPNQITSTPSGTVFPNGTYTVLTQAVTVMNGNTVNALYYLRAGSSTGKSLPFNLIAHNQRNQLRSDLNKLAPAYMLSGATHATRNQTYARRIAAALLDWARFMPNYTVTAKNSASFINTGPSYILGSDLQRASDHNGLAHEWADDELLAFDAIYDSPALASYSTELGFDVRGYIKTNLFCDEGDFIVYHVPPDVATDSNLSGPFTVLALVARVLNRPDYIVWMDQYLGITVREKIHRDGALSEGMGYSIGYLNENQNGAENTRDYFLTRPADTAQLQAISNRAGIYVNILTYGQQQWSKLALPNGQLPSFGDTPFNTYFSARNNGLSWLLPSYGTVSMGAGSSSTTAVQLNQNFSGDNNHMRSDTTAYTLWAFGNEVLGNVRYHNGTAGRQFTEQILAYNAVTIDRTDMSSPSANTYGNGDLTLYEPGNSGLAVTEIDGQRAYSNKASRYQRIMLLNTFDLNRPYVVDVMRVTGGTTHDYVWHGSIRYDQTSECSFSLVTNTATYPMLEGGEVWSDPTDSGDSFPYYGFWRNVNSNTAPGNFQITYRDASASNRDTRLWMTDAAGAAAANVYIGRTPVPARANGEPADWFVNGLWRPSSIIRKRITSGSLSNLFVSVIEPMNNGVGTITNVERLAMNGSSLESCALKITFTDGRADTYVVNLRNPAVAGANTGSTTVTTTNGEFSLAGRIGLHLASPGGSRVWAVNATQFTYPGSSFAPTNLYYSGSIIGETRKQTGGSNDAFITTTPLPTGTTLRGKFLSLTFGTLSGSGTTGINEMFLIDQVLLTNGQYHICFTNDHQLEITNSTTTVEQMGPLRTFSGTNQFEIALSASTTSSLPGAPGGLIAVPGNTRALLMWDSSGATSYNVKRSTTNGGPYLPLVSSVPSNTYTDTNLLNGMTYYYVVSAVNPFGEGPNAAQVSATPAAIVPPGPVARYTFDDNTANDSSGHNNNGTLAGTAAIVTDAVRGKVLSLDGVGGKVDLGNPAGLNIIGQCTMTAWARLNSGMTGNHGLLQRGHQSNPSREFVLRVGISGTTYEFGTWSPNEHATLAIPANDIGQGNWVHLAGTMTLVGTNYTYRLYRNGVEVGSYIGGDGLQNDYTVGWAIGARGGVSGYERVFNGYLDDVRIYDTPLSQAVIQSLMVGAPLTTQPRIVSAAVNGANLVFSGTNGVPGSIYYLLSSTNIALPLANWTRVATNVFGADGSFASTNTSGGSPQKFFRLLLAP
ncbi:MAG: hypothetical protein EPO07_12190 [Verrucomicrobia bacterium]|nr:MAG: hypothetical protein EPO07_12190 [Verrucomicrobiota bacterium]